MSINKMTIIGIYIIIFDLWGCYFQYQQKNYLVTAFFAFLIGLIVSNIIWSIQLQKQSRLINKILDDYFAEVEKKHKEIQEKMFENLRN